MHINISFQSRQSVLDVVEVLSLTSSDSINNTSGVNVELT